MRTLGIASILAIPLLLAACAGGGSGTDEVIHVSTSPDKVSHCVVENDRGADTVYATPGIVSVQRSSAPLTVSCRTLDNWSGRREIAPHGAYADPGTVAADAVLTAVGGGDLSKELDRSRAYPREVTIELRKEANLAR